MDALDLGTKAVVFIDLALLGLVLCVAAVRLLASGAVAGPVARAAKKVQQDEKKRRQKQAEIGSVDLT